MRQSPISSATSPAAEPLLWRGHSGREYKIVRENLSRFALNGKSMFILADAGRALWVGSEHDLIADSTSRSRFRHALARSTEVFKLAENLDPDTAMSKALDIETGGLVEPEQFDAAG